MDMTEEGARASVIGMPAMGQDGIVQGRNPGLLAERGRPERARPIHAWCMIDGRLRP